MDEHSPANKRRVGDECQHNVCVILLNTLYQQNKPMCHGTCFIVSVHNQYFMINGPICSPRVPAVQNLHTHLPCDDVQNIFSIKKGFCFTLMSTHSCSTRFLDCFAFNFPFLDVISSGRGLHVPSRCLDIKVEIYSLHLDDWKFVQMTELMTEGYVVCK